MPPLRAVASVERVGAMMTWETIRHFYSDTLRRSIIRGSQPYSDTLHPGNGQAIRGVNLGGWLVLEKWMTPELFRGGGAADEYTLWSHATEAVKRRIKKHRDSFITREDFVWLKAHGITAVRLPIGYWVFGDAEPYEPTIMYVERAFQWAAETGIRILLDLHAAPGSQNGQDHSGRMGEAGWDKDPANVNRSLEVIGRLARQFGAQQALLGFELLNEPSQGLDRQILTDYYEAAYRIIREECGEKPWIVFSDGFQPRRWRHALRGPQYTRVFIDTHQYQTFSEADRQLTPDQHIAKTTTDVAHQLRDMARYHPVIVGEWNLTLDGKSLRNPDGTPLDEAQKETVYRAYGSAQLLTYGQTRAWFFWNYKTFGGGTQSFRDAVRRGWLPSA